MPKLTFLAMFLLGSGHLQADAIYTDFGTDPNPIFITGSGTYVTNGGTDFSTAYQFSVASSFNYLVTEIDFVAALNSGNNLISATIYADNGGSPGTELYSTGALSGLMGTSASPQEITESVTGGPILDSGASYWLSLDGDTSSSITWNYNGNYSSGTLATDSDSGWTVSNSRVLGAFEIDGTVASPEPATLLLIAPVLAGLTLAARRRILKGN